jgi:hypothetical protein
VAAIELLVLHDAPARVRSFLDVDSLAKIRFVDTAALHRRAAGHRDLEQFAYGEADRSILCLPIDGPRSAVRTAIEGLARDAIGAIVAPSPDDGRPPAWWSLDLLLRSGAAAVDLRSARWHDQSGLWWADRAGPRRLPVVTRGPVGDRRLADLLGALHECGPVHQIALWLEDVALGRIAPESADWDAVLCATYVTQAFAHVAQLSTTNP